MWFTIVSDKGVLCNASSCVWLCQSPGGAECVSQGRGLWEPAGLAQRTRTARSETAASLGEQLGAGVSQVIWDDKDLSCLLGILGSLSAPMPCSVTPWLCTRGKGGGSSWLLLLTLDFACSFGYLGKGVIGPWDVWWGCGQSPGCCW